MGIFLDGLLLMEMTVFDNFRMASFLGHALKDMLILMFFLLSTVLLISLDAYILEFHICLSLIFTYIFLLLSFQLDAHRYNGGFPYHEKSQ